MSVYFIQAGEGGPIKIGRSTNPAGRLEALQTACAEVCRLLGTMDGSATEEAALHHQFHRFLIRGEWFRPGPELLAFIAEHATVPDAVPASDCMPEWPSGRSRLGIDYAVFKVRRYAAEQGLTRNQLAKMSGLHWHSLRDMEQAGWNPTLQTLRRLEAIIPDDAAGRPS